MKITVIANEELKKELLAQGLQDQVHTEWRDEIIAVPGADAYIDLLFNNDEERKDKLKKLQPALIIVNAVNTCLDELPAGFVRINAWNSLLQRPLTEAAAAQNDKAAAEKIFSCFNKKIEWMPDVPGFITARVISMIINEAYFALDEKVSSKEEIDTAMKLGTNYPYGPFEWAAKIGLKNIYGLLENLSRKNSRYIPSGLLQKEARPA